MPPANTTSHTLTNSLRQDSTYHRDSIYIREYIRGDTVYLDHWRDRWMERTITRTDTLYRDREVTEQLPPEKYIPRTVRCLAWIGAFTLFAILLRLLWRLCIRN